MLTLKIGILLFCAAIPLHVCFAEPSLTRNEASKRRPLQHRMPMRMTAAKAEQAATDNATQRAAAAEPGPGRRNSAEVNYLLPAAEIVGFEILLNQYNRHFDSEKDLYKTNAHTIKNNWHSGWGLDRDKFSINQIGHPYQGSIYYGFGRLSGLNFWESAGYTALGSFAWEEAGETTRPSINDQITTTFGGSFLGEALVRVAKRLWNFGNTEVDTAENVGASLVSPPEAINRLALGHTINSDPPNGAPGVFSELSIGGARNHDSSPAGDSSSSDGNIGFVQLNYSFGLPGKSGYGYHRPFDYFRLASRITSSKKDKVESVFVDGLIYGDTYKQARELQGIYGLYGTYDYFAPGLFRTGTSGLALGTTAQWKMSQNIATQGTFLGGAGFGAAGTVQATDGNRNYHYGAVPQALASLKFIIGERTAFEIAERGYHVAGSSADTSGTTGENILREDISLTVRVAGHHGVGLQYGRALRAAFFDVGRDEHQRVETIGIFYSYLSNENLGAVE